MKKIIVLIVILIIAVALFIFSSAKSKFYFIHNVDDLKGKVAEADFQALKGLEQNFSDICRDPYSAHYKESKKERLNAVIEKRKLVIKKYTDINILSWICSESGKCDIGYPDKNKTYP